MIRLPGTGRGAAALATIILSVAMGTALAQAPATPAADAQPTPSQQQARELLYAMARYLSGLPGFEVSLVSSYDAVQDTGQKIEFNEVRALAVARPDKLRMEQVRSDGSEDLLVFDGKSITIFDAAGNVYAQAPQPGSIDDSVTYFIRELGMKLPIGALLTTRFADELERRVKSVDYVELTDILPVPAHHIAGRMSNVDFQVWIAEGDKPLPLRIVLTYVQEPGEPQFRAQFLDWHLQVPTGAELFSFTPPAGARQIAFAVQVPEMVSGAPESASRTEGAKP